MKPSIHNLFLLSLLLLPVVQPVLNAETTLTLGKTSGQQGENKTVSLYLTSSEGVVAAQFDLYYDPALVSIGKMEDGSALDDHVSYVQEIASGIMRVSLLSNTNKRFNDGSLMNIQLGFNQSVGQGTAALTLQNVLLIDDQIQSLQHSELRPVGKPSIETVKATVVGNRVDFEAVVESSLGLGYHWDFGDGDTSSLASVSHAYSTPGQYDVTLAVSNLISTATAYALVQVNPGGAVVVLSNLTQYFDGQPKTVTVITDPPGLDYTSTYNGSNRAPVEEGSYTVEVTIQESGYQGSVTGILVVKGWLDSVQADLEDVGNNWKKLSWFGFFHQDSSKWVYHLDHGWIFPRASGRDSLWMYWPEGDWLWASSDLYPLLHSSGNGSDFDGLGWLYYFQGTRNPAHFFNYNASRWQSRQPK
jgi:hypothetical protein